MSAQTPEDPDDATSDQLGSLSIEDDPDGTVDPADLRDTADDDDQDVGYSPEYSEADLED